jgi:hypothetical protein
MYEWLVENGFIENYYASNLPYPLAKFDFAALEKQVRHDMFWHPHYRKTGQKALDVLKEVSNG